MIESYYILLLFPAVFIYLTYSNRSNKMYWPMTLFYAIGGLFGFLLTQLDLFPNSVNYGRQGVSLFASIYLLSCFILLFEPIRGNAIGYNYEGRVNIHNIRVFCNIFIVISILYVIAIYPYINVAVNAFDAMAYHNEILENGGLDISGGSSALFKIFSFQEMLRPIFTFLFCQIISDNRFSIKYKILLGASCIIPTLMHSFAASLRNIAIFSIIDFLLCFLLFFPLYSKHARKAVVFVGSAIGAIVAFIVITFTILRFSDSTASDIATYSLYRYAGEPIVNFNTMLWDNGEYLYGDKSFNTVRAILGFDVTEQSMQREYYSGLNYVIYCFYSIVGNFYMDFGFWGGIGFTLLIALIFNLILNKRLKHNTITRYMIIFLYVSFTIKNYFYFMFMGSNNILFIWYCIFVLIINKAIDKGHINKVKL